MATERLRYVALGLTTGAEDGTSWADAYRTMGAMWTGEAGSLITADEWLHVYIRSNDGTAQTARADVWLGSGTNTDATRYILLEAAESDYADKTGINASNFRWSVAGLASGVYEDFVRFKGLQMQGKIGVVDVEASNDIRFIDCYFETTTGVDAIGGGDADSSLTVENSIIVGPGDSNGITIEGTASIYNTTIYGWLNGLDGDGTSTVTNCAIGNNTDDIDIGLGSWTITYCATDDGDGTNGVTAPTWTNEFAGPGSGDFTLQSGYELEGAGIGPSSDASVPTTDIDGTTRSGATCDIGADEIAAAGGSIVPLIMHHRRQMQ